MGNQYEATSEVGVTERLTLATATGLPFAALAFHFATGLIGIAAGFIAVSVRKGGAWHRGSGLAFVYAMIATGLTASGIAAYEGKITNTGGAVIVYFVVTAWTAVKPLPGVGSSRQLAIAFMVLALSLSALGYAQGFSAWARPGHQIGGVPAGMMFFMSTILLLGAIGDARMLATGALQGSRRVARHLWRMSWAFFIATGSFFLGQMKVIPQPIRSVPLLLALGVSPLIILLYWMWRVRLRKNLRGLVTVKPIAVADAA